MIKTMKMYDLENQIMTCWNVTDDINSLYKHYGDKDMTQDQVANILLGLKELYDIKFESLFATYEEALKEIAQENRSTDMLVDKLMADIAELRRTDLRPDHDFPEQK